MANFKKIAVSTASVVMASSMALALAACGGDGSTGDYKFSPYASDKYEEVSGVRYDDVLGEFYTLYSAAKAEGTDIAKRYALMAQAEAKLYESGTLLPTQAQGGNYAISKVANRTVSSVAWGNDSDRFHYSVVTDKLITAADRTAMKEYVTENPGMTGAEYLTWVKNYLTTHGYTLANTYDYASTSDPATFDVLATSQQVDSLVVVQTFDGLIEYDVMNQMQPAMAEAIPEAVAAEPVESEVSEGVQEDTVTFTFKIREGQQWVTSQGEKAADFLASDFVTGFHHMLDAKGGLEWLAEGVIVGASTYINGAAKDFSVVGVTADDSAMTVTYRVYKSAESYFRTMLAYSMFAPMSTSFYESKGGKFGTQFDDTATEYTYGKSITDIAYCGPYRISQYTQDNIITFTKNESWWNNGGANARNVDTINFHYVSTDDATETYRRVKAGTLSGCGLVGANVTTAKSEKLNSTDEKNIFETYAYTSAMDSTAFCAFVNVNRGAFANANDGAGASTKNDVEKARAYAALSDVNFRRALLTSVDRVAYMNAVLGDETLALQGINNMYTPGTFVTLPEAATITMNGVKKTYNAGTAYGQIVQDQLDADGIEITVWKEVNNEMAYTGFDGWHNETYAKSEFNKALNTLAAFGIVIDADHPVYIDYPYNSANSYYTARAQVLKQNIERVLDGKVVLNLVSMTAAQWQAAGYRTSNGEESNYDIYDLSGWGPDFGDPTTYLDTMLPDGSGYMTKQLGLW